MQRNLTLRSSVTHRIRQILTDNGFMEIETPILFKSTPEGAREFIVPSRKTPGMFYALPQSPQQYKQLLMASGFDRYYQIAKCFRDEDLRADRQPEFTQIDLELAFTDKDQVMDIVESMIKEIWKEFKQHSFQSPFLRLSYKQAMEKVNYLIL